MGLQLNRVKNTPCSGNINFPVNKKFQFQDAQEMILIFSPNVFADFKK